jgi:hypothetical protein
MNIERFKILVEAYGADPSRWPEGERDAAVAFAETSPEARRLLAEAAALDRLLDAAETTPAARALEERILATFSERPRSFARWYDVLTARPLPWLPGAAIAASLALGLMVGAALPGVAGIGDGAAVDPALIALGGGDADLWSEWGEDS